ncbi:MAG: discoidin domain-containing protein, partial [Nitrososphaeraceae archaeon]|nr:discoidin domain-containing protein [Nitrososphaeraceae archaeon]
MRGNLPKLALSYHLRSNQLKIGISVVSFLILIFTNPLVQPSQVYGQSDPFTTSNTCSKLPVSGITASGSDSVNLPSHAIDQNLNTRWSNMGLGSWIQIDLGQENVICTVGLNWHRGNERVNTFVISTSKDGKTFTNAYSGKSDGTSLTEQKYNLQSQTGRFVRVMVNGNTQSNWISISEFKIYGYKGSSESCISSQVSQATASAPSSQSGFPSSKAVDNNLNTVWSNYGVGSSIQLDLGSSKNICSVDIAWYKGNERQNNFIVSTSQDGKSYKTVISTVSSGKSLSYEKYNVVDTNARYMRITVNGNNQNNYASISEIKTMVSSSSPSQVQCTIGHVQNANTSGSQVGFPGTNVLDDNLDTRWSNNGVGSWIQLDLGSLNKVCDISIAWYKGNERQNNFVISTSNDGVTFTNVLSSKSTGSTLNPEKYNIVDINARYIRITVNGNTLNSY